MCVYVPCLSSLCVFFNFAIQQYVLFEIRKTFENHEIGGEKTF